MDRRELLKAVAAALLAFAPKPRPHFTADTINLCEDCYKVMLCYGRKNGKTLMQAALAGEMEHLKRMGVHGA